MDSNPEVSVITVNSLIENWIDNSDAQNEKDLAVFLDQVGSNPNERYTGFWKAFKGETLLTFGSRMGQVKLVKGLLDRTPDSKNILNMFPIDVERRTEDFYTPLMCAVLNNRFEIAEILLSKHADVNATRMNRAALSMAYTNNNLKMAHLLLKHRALINVPIALARALSFSSPDSDKDSVEIHLACPEAKTEDISPRKSKLSS